MKSIFAFALFLISAQSTLAQTPGEPAKRLTAFTNVQTACKAMVVTNPEVARSFVVATTRSLSTVCECAALLTVADMSDHQINSLLDGNKQTANEAIQPLSENVSRCIKLD